MDGDTVLGETSGELIEVFVEALDHVRADGVRALAARFPIGQGRERGRADFEPSLGVGV